MLLIVSHTYFSEWGPLQIKAESELFLSTQTQMSEIRIQNICGIKPLGH